MNEFYLTLTKVFVIAIILLAIAFLLTFDPFEKIKNLTEKKRRIKARKTVITYQPEELYTNSEIKKIVLEYLDSHGLIVTEANNGNNCN